MRFLYRGKIGTLLAYLSENGYHERLSDVLIEPTTLDEIFMGYYREEEAEQ